MNKSKGNRSSYCDRACLFQNLIRAAHYWTEPFNLSAYFKHFPRFSGSNREPVTKSQSCTTSKMTLQANPQALIEQLQLLTADPSSYFQDEAQKRAFHRLARQAATAVEEPFETMQRLVYSVSDVGTE
jgi:hypothetical protein